MRTCMELRRVLFRSLTTLHYPISAPGPFDLDDAVEGLVKGGELRARVHLFLEQHEARELVAVELPLRALREGVDLSHFIRARRGRQKLDHGPPRSAPRQARRRPAQPHPRAG